MSEERTIKPNNPADFTPQLSNYKSLQPFRFWCQRVLPLVYDDSLSYYELLCKVVDYLNKTMEDVETLHGDVTNLHTAYKELQDYVNNYFSTLDVQEEINNKLDEMATSGELNNLIEPLLPPLISDWLSKNITTTSPVIDKTLSISGAGADAKVTGENFSLSLMSSYFVFSKSNLDDLNNAPDNKIGYFNLASSAEKPDNYPLTESGVSTLWTIKQYNTDLKTQFLIHSNGKIRVRQYTNAWGGWYDAYRDLIQSNYTVFSKDNLNSVDNAPINSIGYFNTPLSNTPENYPFTVSGTALLFTIKSYGSNLITQYFMHSSGEFRLRQYTNSWSSWLDPSYDSIKSNYAVFSSANLASIDNAPVNSIGYFNVASTADKPINYPFEKKGTATLWTIKQKNTQLITQYFMHITGDLRIRQYTGAWSDWSSSQTNKKEYVLSKTGGDFNSLKTALETVKGLKNAEITVYDTWDVISELGEDYINSVDSSHRGLEIGSGCKLIGASNSKIICNYTGSNANVIQWLSAFNVSSGGATFENITIESSNIRYAIHDELSGTEEFSTCKYINCNFSHVADSPGYTQCIGGGLGVNQYVEIKGCTFKTPGKSDVTEVSYHNDSSGNVNAKSNIVITDCAFINGYADFIIYGDSTNVTPVLVCNNKMSRKPQIRNGSYAPNTNMVLTEFNNSVE